VPDFLAARTYNNKVDEQQARLANVTLALGIICLVLAFLAPCLVVAIGVALMGHFGIALAGVLLLMGLILVRTAWDIRNPGPDEFIKCEGCGYNLTGNVTGRCPECGRMM